MKFVFGVVAVAILLPQALFASELTIRPFLIDQTMVPRESVQETISIKSAYPYRKAKVYATVNEITVGVDGEIKDFVTPVMTDRTNSVTSWFEISRGAIEILPDESVEIPFKISIHPYAEPGEYHAFIGFVESNKRYLAEEVAMRGDADGVVVKVTIADERTDSMRITQMSVDRVVSRDDERFVEITVENAGDLASAPQGELIFYNSRGAEVTSIPVNAAGVTIRPNQTETFRATIPMNEALGSFKANVSLAYGENKRANLFDSTSFFLLPMHYLLILIGALSFLVLILFILVRRSRQSYVDPTDGDSVAMYVRDGHNPNPTDHDIDLKK